MKVVVAIDSLKGSLSSIEAGRAIKEGILKVDPKIDVVVKPIADGGEGTTEALIEALGGKWVTHTVCGPMLNKVSASYGIVESSSMAILEMASAAGITLVEKSQLNPLEATTYGVGELILDAIERGMRNFIIGIGGSATNDCGVGMLKALGYRFLDANGKEVSLGAKGLRKVCTIDDQNVSPKLKECQFKVACDVNNPLYGLNGATYIFGPQKGVLEEMKKPLDEAVKQFAEKSSKFTKNDYSMTSGAGAAGGLGYAFLSYLNAELISGVSLVLNTINLEQEVKKADYVMTGEGQLDGQTAMGKVPIGIAKLAKKYHVPVIALAGSLAEDAYKCNGEGIDACFSILPRVMMLEQAMDSETTKRHLKNTAEQIFRLLTL